MHRKNVKVIFSYPPYLLDADTPTTGWEKVDVEFNKEIEGIGSFILDSRSKHFFSRDYFFNGKSHLNEVGRKKNTRNFIEHFQQMQSSPRQ